MFRLQCDEVLCKIYHLRIDKLPGTDTLLVDVFIRLYSGDTNGGDMSPVWLLEMAHRTRSGRKRPTTAPTSLKRYLLALCDDFENLVRVRYIDHVEKFPDVESHMVAKHRRSSRRKEYGQYERRVLKCIGVFRQLLVETREENPLRAAVVRAVPAALPADLWHIVLGYL
jgi:hypothetical protein